MNGFAVLGQGNGGDDGDVDRHHHVSLLSPENLSVIETFDLPFEHEYPARGGSCGSLLYFNGGRGKIVVWYSTTKQIFRVIDPPDGFEVKSTGLGYDAKSEDYKLVRHCVRKEVSTGIVQDSFFDLYSFNRGTSKKLETPFADMGPNAIGVYLIQTGCCYWEAWLFEQPFYPHCILSFDFATEIFDHFPLPGSLVLSDMCELVEVLDHLGVVVHRPIDTGSLMDVFVRMETVWYRIYSVNFDEHVIRPVGLKDGHLLFLEAKERGWCSQLMAYDLDTGTSTKLNIKVPRGHMFGISYCETTGISNAETADPYSIPVTIISPNKEEEKEEKEENKKQQQKQEKKKKKKKKKKKEEEKVKVKDQNMGHIPHSRTMRVKAYNSIEEVEHLPLKSLNI